jgi:hypothetical protein
MKLDRIGSDIPAVPREYRTYHGSILRTQPNAAARFAAACATLPDALVLHDVARDEVSLSFGARTQEVHDRLHTLGCRVKLSGWRAQKVLRFAFSGRSIGDDLSHELANVIKLALGEMEVADSRLW